MPSKQEIRMLQGTVLEVEKTGETKKDEEGNTWEKCIFSLELTGFSKRTPHVILPNNLKGKKIKLIRWCLFDWHYKIGVRKTLEPDETDAVMKGKASDSVHW
ncbi:MAG: hypothetical protein WED07_00585 [Candidatus Freyarchaeum deiterrae]